ncbi:hypothetical protein D9613_012090 [Agrocybe pediades]|uniref:CCHC-type domain-containing protein n=1 Tax=Agrocybe pediades TaxID=84607 RepID=A0A8H4VVG3_9AGAR|nr:hypothetical protein D9613_012090 [Agrocybe pediades]
MVPPSEPISIPIPQPSLPSCLRCSETGHLAKDCPLRFDVRYMDDEELRATVREFPTPPIVDLSSPAPKSKTPALHSQFSNRFSILPVEDTSALSTQTEKDETVQESVAKAPRVKRRGWEKRMPTKLVIREYTDL